MAALCRNLSGTQKEIRTVTGKRSDSLQGVQTIHLRYSMTGT